MRVAIMFSGGKDSVHAVDYCKKAGHEIAALVAVKPKNTEAYLYHYPMVEWTRLQAEALDIPLVYVKAAEIGPKEEAAAVRDTFRSLDVDAIVLGGVGLQETQITALEAIAAESGKKMIISHQNLTSKELLDEEVRSGADIRIIDVAAEGLTPEWIGRKLDTSTVDDLKKTSDSFGFDALGEGGHYNTFVVDSPHFKKRIEFQKINTVWDKETDSGYLEVKNAVLVDK